MRQAILLPGVVNGQLRHRKNALSRLIRYEGILYQFENPTRMCSPTHSKSWASGLTSCSNSLSTMSERTFGGPNLSIFRRRLFLLFSLLAFEASEWLYFPVTRRSKPGCLQVYHLLLSAIVWTLRPGTRQLG